MASDALVNCNGRFIVLAQLVSECPCHVTRHEGFPCFDALLRKALLIHVIIFGLLDRLRAIFLGCKQ